ncbi:hypothetical protein BDP81DRAFT_389075 [Colletotrichum phormii]|uniref:Uncharacterized protein n=1 Tax=Colletotrichum phormii TaxID=359342 RepID=A0AAJ0A4D0_9PEZI|nr:uncharacterized protein BDP81DRAFT_389075 [Colletotrichum phormii]KAK1656262.1 hypothetical protein BDP81DRAFT_389075 [Colletotrichum phormii]
MATESEEDANIALAAARRADVVEGKLMELKVPHRFGIERLQAAKAKQAVGLLISQGRENVSTAWFAWFVDFEIWDYIHEKFAKYRDHETFPWIDLEPAVKPKTPEDASAWCNGLKDAIKQRYHLPALERKRLGLSLMKPEPTLLRDTDEAAAALRQEIWNNVFPGRKHPHGKAFEVIIPSAVKMSSDLNWDILQHENRLPDAVCFFTVGRVHRRGHFAVALVLGYNPGVIDNEANRLILTKAYDVVLKWAQTIVITGRSMKLTRAFKGFDLPEPELGGDGEDTRMGGMEEETELTQEQLELCAGEFDVVPLNSVADYAVFRVSEWLHQEVGRTPAEDRCRLLRDWCQLEDGKFHQNLEGMTREDLQKACREAWMGKTHNWKETLDLTMWSWTEEVYWAKKIMESFDS